VLPRTNYGASKIAAEALCLQFDAQLRVPITVLRFPAPYGFTGTADGVIPRFIKSARAGQPLTLWGTGARRQTFTFVADIGVACGRAIERGARGIYHIAGPASVSMRELADAVVRAFPGTGAAVAFNGQADPQESVQVQISYEKARRDFGYAPGYSLDRGLAAIAGRDAASFIFEAVS
jgi:nucleoside-diphosphate-sugar epimerase